MSVNSTRSWSARVPPSANPVSLASGFNLGWFFGPRLRAPGGSGGYRWGRVYGDLNACLWTFSGAVAGSATAADGCGTAATLPTSVFTNGQIGGSADDGATVATVARAGCSTWDGSHIRGYGNVQPWKVPAVASSPLNGRIAVGQTVLWRYVSRDGKWVMIRDPRADSTDGVGQQGWYFIPRNCLPATLPG